jgi:hypothetical protein
MSNITGGGNYVSVESNLNKNIALSLANIIKIVINDANNRMKIPFLKPAIEAEVNKHTGYTDLQQSTDIEAKIKAKINALIDYWNKEEMNKENAKFMNENKEKFIKQK